MKMSSKSPIKSEKIALAFTDELWEKIAQNGFGAFSKNDLCDYLLYLFNKHGGHFFDKNSNEQNERLLKTTAAKIKASKKNIAVKFMDENEYKKIFSDFLSDLANDKIKLRASKTQRGFLTFAIENKALRDILAAKLKATERDTIEFSLNTERVLVDADSFIAMISKMLPANKQKELEKSVNKLLISDKKDEKQRDFSKLSLAEWISTSPNLIPTILEFARLCV